MLLRFGKPGPWVVSGKRLLLQEVWGPHGPDERHAHLQDYDEKGDYIRTWVPELAKIPAPSIFEPWRLSRGDQEKYSVQIGVSVYFSSTAFIQTASRDQVQA